MKKPCPICGEYYHFVGKHASKAHPDKYPEDFTKSNHD